MLSQSSTSKTQVHMDRKQNNKHCSSGYDECLYSSTESHTIVVISVRVLQRSTVKVFK